MASTQTAILGGNATDAPAPAQVARRRWAVGIYLLGVTGLVTIAVWLYDQGCKWEMTPLVFGAMLMSITAFTALGALLVIYRSGNRIGRLCGLIALGQGITMITGMALPCGAAAAQPWPWLPYAGWFVYTFAPVFGVLPMFVLTPLLYPTGAFLSRRWAWATAAGIGLLLVTLIADGLVPDFRSHNAVTFSIDLDNPFGVAGLPGWWHPFLMRLNLFLLVGLCLLGIAAVVVRYRRSVGEERQQMKWLAFFLVTVVGVQLLVFELPGNLFEPEIFFTIWYDLIILLVLLGFPLTIGVAIFKYRLYDIDLIINRTLVYSALTAIVVGVYALVVGGLAALFHTHSTFVLSLVATGLIAVLFQPLRDRLQRAANRLMFGQRDEPYAVLSQLMRQLERPATPDEVLAAVVATTAQTLKLPYVAVDLGDGADRRSVAQVGRPVAAPLRLPVRYQNEVVGQLVVSPRSPQEPFGPREVELLGDIAAQVGAVAHAVGLHAALLRSREGLVLAREEERRRIRRDLHDGLGPALASQTFKLDAALDLLGSDPEAAGEVLAELKAHTQTLVADIRRLVYELRPPALDDLGLLGALEAHIGQIRHSRGGPDVAVIADPAPLPALSAAVEVAAYRIALEGITNVLRHAHASTCRVRLALQPHSLRVEVWDDGKGIPSDVVAGVGLTSMRDRAEELGGTLTIQGRPGDNRVRAHLPLVDVTRNPAAAGGAP